jgi:hypothetical protein
VDGQPDADETPAAEQVERNLALQREARELAGHPEDRAEVAGLPARTVERLRERPR